jgi:hypothetical protein
MSHRTSAPLQKHVEIVFAEADTFAQFEARENWPPTPLGVREHPRNTDVESLSYLSGGQQRAIVSGIQEPS